MVNRIRRIPDFIGHLTKLSHLEASMNQLESVSDAVSRCRALTTLSLTSNDLKSLPDGLCNITSLVTLKVDDNLLESDLDYEFMMIKESRGNSRDFYFLQCTVLLYIIH